MTPNAEYAGTCGWVRKYGKHGPTVIYRRRWQDLFLKSYWVFCWGCDDKWGPFPDKRLALLMAEGVDFLTPHNGSSGAHAVD